jgi:hypothetical protein
MTSGEHTPVASVEPHAFFATKRFEENVFPGPSGGPDPRLDLFFWHALSSNAQVSIPVSLPSIQDGDASELRVTVHGATEHPLQPHRVELLWNGQSLGTFDLFGRQRHTVLVPLQGATTLAENELVVQQHVTGADPPVLYVDAVEVDYTRLAEAGGPVFAFEQSFDGLQVVTGLVPGTAALYDVTTPSMPAHHDELEVDETGTTSFVAEGEGRRFVVASPDGIVAPSAVQPHFATDLRSETMSADYVIIAASHLVEAAEDLASYRRADGYRALVVDVEDVYWAFADGAPDPLAIRDFLKFASSNWDTAPRFAVLIGKGSLDYRDLLGVGGNWVSPALVATDGGLFPSDSMLGDFDAIDGVPEIPVGRLPITSSDELGPILDAIAAFEENHSTMDALFAADDSERGEFAAAATMLGAWADPSLRREIDLNGENLQEARARLSAMWEGPLAWLSYVGHGGLDRLADEGLLTQTDVPSLASQGSTPFILGWSCNINRFDIPGFFSLGEDLLTKSASVGVYSATGWSNHVDTDALRMALTEAVFDSDAETIGEAILRAHEAAPGEPASLHQVYTLLGDPALRLRAPKSEPGPEPEPEPMPNPDEPGGPGDARSNEPAPSAAGGCSAAPHGPTEGGMALLFALLCLVVGVRARAANATSRR